MRFNFFEYVFFVSTLGAIALFPSARPFLPLLALPAVALVLSLAGITLLINLTLYRKQLTHPMQKRALICAFIAGCTAVLISIAGQSLTPIFIAWAITALCAVFTFGSILARRFFRHVEKDFRRNFSHIMIMSLVANILILALIYCLTLFPPIMAGAVIAIMTFALIF